MQLSCVRSHCLSALDANTQSPKNGECERRRGCKHNWSLLKRFSLDMIFPYYSVATEGQCASVFLWEIRWWCLSSKADCCVQFYCITMSAWNEKGENPERRLNPVYVPPLGKIHGDSACWICGAISERPVTANHCESLSSRPEIIMVAHWTSSATPSVQHRENKSTFPFT